MWNQCLKIRNCHIYDFKKQINKKNPLSLASLKKSENLATVTSQSVMMTISWCWEAAAPFRQDVSSLSPCPTPPSCMTPGCSSHSHYLPWPCGHLSSRSWGWMIVRALACSCVYWISITSMAISTKIKAKILSLKSSWVYEHLSHKCSTHFKCWGQESFFCFFMKKEGVKPLAKQTRFPFRQMPYCTSWESLGIFSTSFCSFLTLGKRVRLNFLTTLKCPNQWEKWHVSLLDLGISYDLKP